ncbi:class I SAM-dependent methyltransferase [bacterium]|nr:class I SAM-dependent methyltransferase [candidate division CSSED10-310 bacterium]
MDKDTGRVCPVELAGSLDNRLRRFFQNPYKILRPYVRVGRTALDLGCGPGFFTIPMAQLVGESGRVIAVDLQQGMLDRVRRKIAGTDLEKRIILHRCDADRIGVSEQVDFALLFYMIHEIPEKNKFFNEMAHIIKGNGQVLIVEPLFHVSRASFKRTLGKAEAAGFIVLPGPRLFPDRTAILRMDH